METNCGCVFLNKNFNTKNLSILKPIIIIEKYDIGEQISKGRFKGEIAKEGCLIINGDLNYIIAFLNSNKSILKYLINIDLTIKYDNDCNFTLSKEHLLFFSELKHDLNITCFQA
ncbi:MAG: hypothetical protein WBP31_14190 [Chitinophagales bacterium]|nr:hypothetical protein [Bacteroidota bacterium]